MTFFEVGLPQEVRDLLARNHIDLDRLSDVSIKWSVDEGVVKITTTMLGLNPEHQTKEQHGSDSSNS